MTMFQWMLILTLATVALPSHAQAPRSDVAMDSALSKEVEVEAQTQQGVPGLFDDLDRAIATLQKNDYNSSQASVDQARKEIGQILGVLGNNPEYREVQLSL